MNSQEPDHSHEVNIPTRTIFLNYNVNGLRPKLDLPHFVEFIRSYDFITLTETFIDYEFQSYLFSDFEIFTAKATRSSNVGRQSGGVIVMIRSCLKKYINHVKTVTDNTIVIRIDKRCLKTYRDILFISTYLPPYDSTYWLSAQCGYGIDSLETCILDLYESHNQCSLVITGDLNARSACRNVVYSDSTLFNPLITTNRSCTPFPRGSCDNSTNMFGDRLLELCDNLGCFILNGLSKYSFDEGLTFVGGVGGSVVDYFIFSCDLSYILRYCNLVIKPEVESDHLPVELVFGDLPGAFLENTTSKDKKFVTKFIWDENKISTFQYELSKCKRKIQKASSFLGANINRALESLTESLLSAGKCMQKRICISNKAPRGQRWFDSECKYNKRLCNNLLKKFKRKPCVQKQDMFTTQTKTYFQLRK